MERNLVNQKFGKLTIVELMPNRHLVRREKMWKCRCDCGTEKVVRTGLLTAGHTKSCGCLKYISRPSSRRKQYGQAAQNALISRYKNRALERGFTFTLTKDECLKLFTSNCHYCHCPPSQVIKQKGWFGEFCYNGIDRVNNKRGYENNNCVTCCKWCNGAKSQMSIKNFFNHIKKIYARTCS